MLELVDAAVVVKDCGGEFSLRGGLFLGARCKGCFLAFTLPMLGKRCLLNCEFGFQSFLTAKLLHKQIIVLFVGFLDVGGQFFRMRFLQSFDSLVILFEFLKLLFEFLAAIVESFLQV